MRMKLNSVPNGEDAVSLDYEQDYALDGALRVREGQPLSRLALPSPAIRSLVMDAWLCPTSCNVFRGTWRVGS